MNAHTHTPGPWKAIGDEIVDHGNGVCDLGHVLASVRMHNGEQEANARLIAEAPAMLEALRDAIRGLDTDGQSSACASLNTTARAILARIDGGK